MCWDVNKLYGWEISQKLLIGGFKWAEDTSKLSKRLLKKLQ